MDTRELIIKSIEKGKLHQLFVETLLDAKSQKTINIKSVSDLNVDKIFSNLEKTDLLCTNDMYAVDQTGYQIWNGEKKCLIEIMGDTFNKHDPSEFLSDEDLLEKLIAIYTEIRNAECVYTVKKAS